MQNPTQTTLEIADEKALHRLAGDLRGSLQIEKNNNFNLINENSSQGELPQRQMNQDIVSMQNLRQPIYDRNTNNSF